MDRLLHAPIQSGRLCMQMTLGMVTEADMETCQHNLMGAMFFYVYVCVYVYVCGQKET